MILSRCYYKSSKMGVLKSHIIIACLNSKDIHTDFSKRQRCENPKIKINVTNKTKFEVFSNIDSKSLNYYFIKHHRNIQINK